MLTLVAAVAVGYLLGAIPSAELAARLKGRRIFEVGSGNMGAMNTARNLGYALGTAVLAADVAKGAAATAAALAMAAVVGLGPLERLVVALAAGVAAVVGHAWSVFVAWRGGKGLATILGVSLPLYPLGGLAGLGLILALVLLTRRAHLAAVLTLLAYPWLVALVALRSGEPLETAFALFTATLPLAVVSLVKHRHQRGPAAS
ncbi:MAG: glycerol-3-phosphate acyltransferase [Trueperaceae bacterium]|nr:glycerol-3-phosphate acyltransferase [Trueperaceae bacterium]